MILALNASWEATEASRMCMSAVDAGFARWFQKDKTANEVTAARLLGVAPSRISAMRSGIDPGPGFLRFASLPKEFWIGFLKEWGIQFFITVVTDREMDRQIKWLNFWMVNTMRRDAALKYGQVFPDVAEDVDEEQERSA